MAQSKKTSPKNTATRLVRINLNPISLIIFGVIITMVFAMLMNTGGLEVTRLSASEFIQNIKEGEFSRLTIRNSGEILAQSKYVLISEQPTELKNVSELKEIDSTELLEILSPADPVEQLRGILLRQPSEQVLELITNTNYIIVRTGNNTQDYIVRGIDKDRLETILADQGTSLSELGVLVSDMSYASAEITTSSLAARAELDEYVAIYNLDGMTVARVRDENISTFGLDWDAGISNFSRIIQEEDIDLANEDVEIGSVIVASVPWGDIISIITLIGFVVLGYFIFRGIQNSGSGLMRFGQSKARMFWGVKPDITFKDVAGVDEAKQELEEIVQFLKTPEKFRKLGARIPKGVLMVGRPGTGKTLLARAVAGEAGVPFFHTSGSEFEEMLVGAGASRVRDLFEKAKKAAPALIFIDEIDAVARKRGTTIQSSTTEQTLNQILVEMDGFETGTNVIVIAATNRPDVLDPAILRPGRFDRRVMLDLPDIKGRKQILDVHSRNKPLSDDVDLERVAKRTIGFSGAELENTLNEAAIIAAKNSRKEIIAKDIEEAASKVTMGPVRKSLVRSGEELKLVAVHEAGHAVAAFFTKNSDPVHRVSILSRGSAGGVTQFLPENDNRMTSKSKLLSRIVVGLGGRAAEDLILDDISTGASSDIQMVTSIAKSMVQKYGMSEKLGLIKYGESDELEHLGYSYGQSQDYSEDTAKLIDNEVREIVEKAYEDVKKIISDNRTKFDKVVSELLEKEVLEAEEFAEILESERGQKTKTKD